MSNLESTTHESTPATIALHFRAPYLRRMVNQAQIEAEVKRALAGGGVKATR